MYNFVRLPVVEFNKKTTGRAIAFDIVKNISVYARDRDVRAVFETAASTTVTSPRLFGFRTTAGLKGNGTSTTKTTMVMFIDPVSLILGG